MLFGVYLNEQLFPVFGRLVWLSYVFATRLYRQTAGKVTSSRQCIGRRNALCKKADDPGIDRRIGQAVELA
jgi:hypothetical protein